jgi:hypothetical protein
MVIPEEMLAAKYAAHKRHGATTASFVRLLSFPACNPGPGHRDLVKKAPV